MIERALLSFTVLYTFIFGAIVDKTMEVSEELNQEVLITEITTFQVVRHESVDTTTTTTMPPVLVADKPRRQIPSDPEKRCPMWEDKFKQFGLPAEIFSYIAWRESRCNPKAHNTTLNRDGSQDLGLVQINSTWRTVTANACGTEHGNMKVLFKVDCNLRVARYLYENGGLGHWSL